jgi:hypothetical protein
MRKLLLLCGFLLCMSLTAVAQDSNGALDVSSPASDTASPSSLSVSDREPWQLEAGFQYQHYKVLGETFHNLGFNSSITRYLNDWFGVEGTVIAGFGHAGPTPTVPATLDAKSFFVGGGPHIALSNRSRFEPWGHVIAGLEHFRFSQTNNKIGLGSNSAVGFLAGGGVDYKIGGRAYWRVQADFIGSHFGDVTQTNYSFGTGLVFNF